MSSNYAAAMTAIAARLASFAPTRTISREAKDYADQVEAQLAAGIFTLLPRGVEGYDYETSDHFDDTPPQTELGTFVFVITGQIKLPENCTGVDVDNAEFAMLAELERFADAGIADADLKDLLLRRSVLSQQQEKPYAWVFTEWRLRLFD